MKLEDQVVSLGLAKKLKKYNVGVEKLGQVALWHWCYDTSRKQWDVVWYGSDDLIRSPKPSYAAFTVAELGEMLPASIPNSEPLKINKGLFGYGKTAKHQWQCMYYDVHFINAETEADARARMLIYLIGSKLI